MKGFLLFSLLLFYSYFVFCQPGNTDSLEQVLKATKEDTLKVKLLNKYALDLVNFNPKQSFRFAKEALNLADSLRFPHGIGTSYSIIGLLFYQQGTYDSALTYHINALKIREQIEDKKGIANSLNNIGSVHRDQGNNEKAIEYQLKSSKLFGEIDDQNGLANSFNNIGIAYIQKGNYETAIEYLLKSLNALQQMGDKTGVAGSLANIGAVYYFQKKYTKALDYFQQSLLIAEDLGDKYAIVSAMINVGQANLDLKHNDKAISSFTKALEISKELNSRERTKLAYLGLADSYAKANDYKKAFEYDRLFYLTNDTLMNEEKSKQINELQIKFETTQKDKEIELLNKDKQLQEFEFQKQKTRKNSIITGVSVLAVSSLLSFAFYKRRREAVMQNKITDSRLRAINAQMNPHFIFNCMQSIQNFIRNKDVQNADAYLLKFASLIRKVLDNSTQKEITLADDLETLENYVELEKLRLDYPLTYKVSIANDVNAEEIFIPPLLIQPFVENAIKHGLQGKNEPGEINIEIKKSENQLEIIITDDGTGRKEKPDVTGEKKSYGIPLTQERLNYLSSSNKIKAIYDVTDVYDAEGRINGTKVFLKTPLI